MRIMISRLDLKLLVDQFSHHDHHKESAVDTRVKTSMIPIAQALNLLYNYDLSSRDIHVEL